MANSIQNEKSLEEELKQAFTSTNSDNNYNATKALVNSIPSIGSLVVTFMESHITPPATKRLQAFLESLVRELEELKAQFPEMEKKEAIYNQILKDLADRGLIKLREAYITEEQSKNNFLPYIYPNIPQLQDRKQNRKLNTVRRSEDIKAIINNSAFRKDKTTDLGKQFIQFIESPSS